MSPEQHDRRGEVEQWWALIVRILAFFLGAFVLVYAMVFSTAQGAERLAFVAVGIGLMGPVVITGVAQSYAILLGRNGRNRDG